jgi:cyclophilin family peptidyl-prolyl cis-trans isomerase
VIRHTVQALLLLVASISIAAAQIVVHIDTSQGRFALEVHPEWAPNGAARFLELVDAKYFDDSRFFRVRAGYIAQFGIAGSPKVAQAWRTRTIADDPVKQSNKRGFAAFAMTGKDTRSTQIYINLVDNTRLDSEGFAPFAKVIEGMEVIDKLHSGYGESSGGGMRTGKQDDMFKEGNAWLDREFPKLDRLIRVQLRGK